MKEELALKNLREVKEVFDKHGIKYWLDFGTLLGAVRDGRIIQWDHDIDLGAKDDCWEKIVSILPELEERGFEVILNNILKFSKDLPYEFLQRDKNFAPYKHSLLFFRFGCLINIFLYKKIEDKYVHLILGNASIISDGLTILYYLLLSQKVYITSKWKFIVKVVNHYLSLLPSKSKKPLFNMVRWAPREKFIVVVPKHYFEKLETIKFYGMTFNVPSNTEDYLRCHYGEDWKTPKKEWVWVKDDRTVRILTKR